MSTDSKKHSKEQSKIPKEKEDSTPSGDSKSDVGEDNQQSKRGDQSEDGSAIPGDKGKR